MSLVELGKAEFFVEKIEDERVRLAEETLLWLIVQMRKLVEMGLKKIAAKSTGKSEKIRWANAVAHVAAVLKAAVEDVELGMIYARLEEAERDFKSSHQSYTVP